MPIYEYVCNSCGLEKDILQRMADDPLTLCPSCNQESLRKKISAAGFRLKGSGWYETDFKTGSKKNLVSDSSAAPDSGSASSAASAPSPAAD